MRDFSQSAILFLLLFTALFGPLLLAMNGVELFPSKEPSPPPPPPIVVKVSCEGPNGWTSFSAEKEKVRVSPYRISAWRIETINGERVTATNCFMQEGGSDE